MRVSRVTPRIRQGNSTQPSDGARDRSEDSAGLDDYIAISCKHVDKTFGANRAVSDVSVDIPAGSVHALCGENGAGKSTLLGIFSGRLAADAGEICVFGTPLRGGRPRESRRLGLVAVYQELTMIPTLSAEANVFLGQPITRFGVLARRRMRRRYRELCQLFEIDIPSSTPVEHLSVSQQQMLEIMRGVQAGARILLLDEPSAALAEHEREVLYRLIERLRDRGDTIVIVSHNLNEVLELSDSISVLRDGRLSRSAPRSEWDKQGLIRAMVGREIEVLAERSTQPIGEQAFRAAHVSLPGALHDIEVSARRGEVVGLWGLVGSGRTTFMRSLAGLEPRSSGVMELDGVSLAWPRSAREAISRGIALVPEDRKRALVLHMDGSSNMWLGRRGLGRLWLHRNGERRACVPYVQFFGFDAKRLPRPVGALSGGNQQKVLLAKWAARDPRLFLIDEPTRGIDIGAKGEVLASLTRLAEEGCTVIVTSSELEEVLAIAHRLLIFAGGRIVRTLTADDREFEVADIVRMGFHDGRGQTTTPTITEDGRK